LVEVKISKIFVISFLALVFGSCAIPLIYYFICFINEIIFIFNFFFFYQLQINIHLYLLDQILPYLIIGWLLFEFMLNPGVFKIKYSRPFRNFVLSKVFKKNIQTLDVNSKIWNSRIQKSEDKKSKKISNKLRHNAHKVKINQFFRTSSLKIINLWTKFKSGFHKSFFRINAALRSFFFSISSTFSLILSFSSHFSSKFSSFFLKLFLKLIMIGSSIK